MISQVRSIRKIGQRSDFLPHVIAGFDGQSSCLYRVEAGPMKMASRECPYKLLVTSRQVKVIRDHEVKNVKLYILGLGGAMHVLGKVS